MNRIMNYYVSTFGSCVVLLLLGSAPFYVYSRRNGTVNGIPFRTMNLKIVGVPPRELYYLRHITAISLHLHTWYIKKNTATFIGQSSADSSLSVLLGLMDGWL